MTALVGFDRVFEVLDLQPLITERPDAVALPRVPRSNGAGPRPPRRWSSTGVSFRYPTASEVSLASLESIALPVPERAGGGQDVLHEVSFTAPSGKLTALVGPSGAGKTTITHLVATALRPPGGARPHRRPRPADLTLDSLHDAVGVVTQDAHMFHDTIRANLLYARPTATEDELIEACRAAQIWDLVAGLPDGLDTVVGDRGYRLSGGEKQRLAIARLLLKAPSVVVLDEATAHLDSESGGGGAARAEDRAGGPDLAGDRAPAVDDPGGRPDPGDRPRPGEWSGARTRSCWRRAGCTPSSITPSSPARRRGRRPSPPVRCRSRPGAARRLPPVPPRRPGPGSAAAATRPPPSRFPGPGAAPGG